jgi:hypothetical protein
VLVAVVVWIGKVVILEQVVLAVVVEGLVQAEQQTKLLVLQTLAVVAVAQVVHLAIVVVGDQVL